MLAFLRCRSGSLHSSGSPPTGLASFTLRFHRATSHAGMTGKHSKIARSLHLAFQPVRRATNPTLILSGHERGHAAAVVAAAIRPTRAAECPGREKKPSFCALLAATLSIRSVGLTVTDTELGTSWSPIAPHAHQPRRHTLSGRSIIVQHRAASRSAVQIRALRVQERGPGIGSEAPSSVSRFPIGRQPKTSQS